MIQDEFNADALTAEVRRLVEDPAYREKMQSDYREIRRLLGGGGASGRVAGAMVSELR